MGQELHWSKKSDQILDKKAWKDNTKIINPAFDGLIDNM